MLVGIAAANLWLAFTAFSQQLLYDNTDHGSCVSAAAEGMMSSSSAFQQLGGVIFLCLKCL